MRQMSKNNFKINVHEYSEYFHKKMIILIYPA